MVRSYNGWAASTSASAIGVNTTWEPIKSHRFPGGVKSGDVETVMTYLVRQLDARVEPIEMYAPGDEWGWAFRPNRNNPDTLSCHASATAIDYNATRHPNRVKYTWTRAQTREIHKILDELGGVIKWLEGFDEMHFEVRGTPAQVRVVAQRLHSTPAAPPKPPPAPTGGLVYRIYWLKQGKGPTEAHRCLCAKAEKGSGWIIWSTYYISSTAELDAWRKKGLVEGNTGSKPTVPRSYYAIHGGAYDNTKAP